MTLAVYYDYLCVCVRLCIILKKSNKKAKHFVYRSNGVFCFLIALNFSPFQSIRFGFFRCLCSVFVCIQSINQRVSQIIFFFFRKYFETIQSTPTLIGFAIWYVFFQIILIFSLFSSIPLCILISYYFHYSRLVCCFLLFRLFRFYFSLHFPPGNRRKIKRRSRKNEQFPIAFKF